ncbi:MAG: phosphoribosylanthranilate isomerase [Deltaproteobacteria bacterium]|nr:phosphoribosylanthranilate isomerase [Deltaproteobacteria bacterium]
MILKLCGFTRPAQAALAGELGATHVGAVLWERSRRGVSDEGQARDIFAAARGAGACPVAVVVDHADPAGLAARVGASVLQLHGAETPAVGAALAAGGLSFWRALRVGGGRSGEAPLPWMQAGAEAIVLDAFVPGLPGGTGARVDDALARPIAAAHPVVLAGGLTPHNVAGAVAAVRPLGVDVASGIERTPGDKDEDLMRAFVMAARAALMTMETR